MLQQRGGSFVRRLGGDTVVNHSVDVAGLRLEMNSVIAGHGLDWHFCQPNHAIIWPSTGTRHFCASVGQTSISRSVTDDSNLVMIPPQVEVKGRWDTPPLGDYIAIFFDPEQALSRMHTSLSEPLMLFRHRELKQSIHELCRESYSSDGLFELYAAGWLSQAVVHLLRAQPGSTRRTETAAGGLSPHRLRSLKDFLEGRLSETILLSDMAAVVGMSERHLIRAFEQSTGETPHRYVVGRRMTRARDLLVNSEENVTDVALSCGYSSIQHFSSSFRRETGLSPSNYRKVARH